MMLIPQRLFAQATKSPERPACFTRTPEGWTPISWRAYASQVRTLGRALIAAGMPAGGSVAILGFNRPEWTSMALGCMAAGGAPAGIYTTSSPEEVQYIVAHAGARVLLIEDEEQWKKIVRVRDQLPGLAKVVGMAGLRVDDPLFERWEDFLASGTTMFEAEFEARLAALKAEDLGTLIYTSGTTGPPKGVMLSHGNLAWTADAARDLVGVGENDCMLSYLPLSHIAEQMFSIHASVSVGYSVYFAESVAKVVDNLKDVQPTVFFGVPRIWEKMYAAIQAKLADATGIKAKLVTWVRGVARRVSALRMAGQEPTGWLEFQYDLAQKLVLGKLKTAIGLSRARYCVSGAAPIAPEVLEFFSSLDILVHEVYGQSEDCGPTSFNQLGKMKLGSVGAPLPGCEVRIADDGEILVRGPNVFMGYYKDPAATADTLIDGWLHSGDLGRLDADGCLHITGRKKEILITSGGKNITPRNIEEGIKGLPLVGEAVVIGDRRPYLTALIALEPEAAARYAAAQGVAVSALPTHAPLLASLQQGLDRVNEKLARVETIKKFRVLPRPFTIDDGELTPTLKLKRRVIYQNHAALIDEMYAGEE